MENERKWIYLSYIAATLLVSWVVGKFMTLGFSYMHWRNTTVLGVLSLTSLISVASCATAAYFYFRQEKVNVFSVEVLQELKKVSWPPRKTAWLSTVVVVVLVFVVSVIMWVYDSVCALLVGKVLGI